MQRKHKIILSTFIIMGVLLIGCGVQKQTIRKVKYVDTYKKTQTKTAIRTIPELKLVQGLQQTVIKEGVSVSCELTPFTLDRSERRIRKATYADPDAPGYDVYENYTKPIYTIKPQNLLFKIRIKNNQDRVLKLVNAPVILILDGSQTALPDDALLDWKAALIVKGFEKDFQMHGPDVYQLLDSKQLYIAVHDVPVAFDNAGNITRKDNFEWTFKIDKKEITKLDRIHFTYEKIPVKKVECIECSGIGISTCSWCEGQGYTKDIFGKRMQCDRCKGTGKAKCNRCGGQGSYLSPESPAPKIASEVIWTGWNVSVETNPPGATIRVYDINDEKYKDAGKSNTKVKWYKFKENNYLYKSKEKAFPIIVEYNGMSVKVLPYDKAGKELKKVTIDFSSGGESTILFGQKVN